MSRLEFHTAARYADQHASRLRSGDALHLAVAANHGALRSSVESAFHEDVSEGRYQLRLVASGAFERAHHWLLTRKTALRTLDALHLACAEHSEAELVTHGSCPISGR